MMLVFCSMFLAIFSVSQTISLRPEHSLVPPYEPDNANFLNWDLTGSAELGGDYIRLTSDEEDRQGAIWNSFPSFSNNWEFQVQFRIHGKGVFLNGDGIAIWYVKESDMLHNGPVFGSKDYFSGLGIFIDTYPNQEEPHKHYHPYISAMVNNGSLHYDHEEDGAMTQIGGCHAFVRNLDFPTKIAISYVNNDLSVYVDNEGINQWKLCFKSAGVYLPTNYNYGISASTSDVTDNHDILSITSLNFDADDLAWEDRSHVIPHVANFEVPERYHKDFDEQKPQKVEETVQKEEIKEERVEMKDPNVEKSTTEDESPPTSLIRKLVYITGAIAIILVSISVYRKYKERKRVAMEKRLF